MWTFHKIKRCSEKQPETHFWNNKHFRILWPTPSSAIEYSVHGSFKTNALCVFSMANFFFAQTQCEAYRKQYVAWKFGILASRKMVITNCRNASLYNQCGFMKRATCCNTLFWFILLLAGYAMHCFLTGMWRYFALWKEHVTSKAKDSLSCVRNEHIDSKAKDILFCVRNTLIQKQRIFCLV